MRWGREAVGRTPKAQARWAVIQELAGDPQNESWRETPKVQEGERLLLEHSNLVETFTCLFTKMPEPCAGFSHSAQHTEGRISAMKQWNSPFPVLPEPLQPEKKPTNTILVVFYHSRSKCWKSRQKEWFLVAGSWENTINDENDEKICVLRDFQWVLKTFHTHCPPGAVRVGMKPLSAVSESGCRWGFSSPLLR